MIIITKRRLTVGRLGEQQARAHLKKNGYAIIDTNYRCRLGEMDIIAREAKTIVFVEVRTKTGSRFGLPEESITPGKARRLLHLAQYYLQTHNLSENPCRIDLVAVTLDSANYSLITLKHIKNILAG